VQENGVADGPATGPEQNSERTLTPTYTPGVDVKEATKTRKISIIVSCVFFFISVIFLILVSFKPTQNNLKSTKPY